MKNKFFTVLSYILVAAIASVITFAACSGDNYAPQSSKLAQIEDIIAECYIGGADRDTLEDYAAAGMVEGTGDRWSYYVPAAEMQAHWDNQNNSYVGIGITVQQREDGQGLDIMAVTKGGPAEEAGILPGDVIYAVDDALTSEVGLDGATELIRGKAGTKVKITVIRGGEKKIFRVERRLVEVVVASGQLLDGNIGLVTITNFNSRCAQSSQQIIEDLQSQGATAFIFDVRNNPGGYRHELVKLLDYLLPEGVLFRSEHYDGSESVDYSYASCLDVPMVVLVNGDSYSAAEFFAAALQEYEAAQVVGTQTCGKGYYQQTIPLPDGSAINLSTGRYYTPNGVCLTEVGGVTPDHVVEVDEQTYMAIYYGQLSAEEDPQIQQAIKVLQGQ